VSSSWSCSAGSKSRWCSCWPWISTSCVASSRRSLPVTGRWFTCARLRPSRVMVRVRTSSSSGASASSCSSRHSARVSGRCSSSQVATPWPQDSTDRRKRPSTRARRAPARTTSARARRPRSSSSASTMRLLPAPVSPVIALRPGPSTSSACSKRARSWRLSSTSMAGPGGTLRRSGSGGSRGSPGGGGKRRRSGAPLPVLVTARERQHAAGPPPSRGAGRNKASGSGAHRPRHRVLRAQLAPAALAA